MRETRPAAAAASVLMAMAIIGLIDNFVVIVAERHGLWQFHAVRMVIALPIIMAVAALGFGTMRPRSWVALGTRSAFVCSSMVVYFGCLAFMPIAEVAAGLFTSPIWVLLLSIVFLGQRVGLVRVAAVAVGFLGVVLVLKPDTGEVSALALLPAAAGLLYAVGSLLTREWCAEESGLALLTFNFVALGLVGLLAMGLLALVPQPVPAGPEGFLLRGWEPLDATFLGWTGFQAVGAIVGVWLLIRGYQMADTSFVAVFEFSFLIFASIWAYVLRTELPDGWTVAGIFLIVSSGIVIVLRGR